MVVAQLVWEWVELLRWCLLEQGRVAAVRRLDRRGVQNEPCERLAECDVWECWW